MDENMKQIIWQAWYSPAGGLTAPADGAVEGDPLFNAICAELLANTDGLSDEEDALAAIGDAIDHLIRDLERVSNALLRV